MERWREVWRVVAKQLNRAGLEALRGALARDDPQLIQGATCYPPLLNSTGDLEVEAGCPIAFAGWQGEGFTWVKQVEGFFQAVCDATDAEFDVPASCRFFLNAWDDLPRQEIRVALLEEVEKALAERHAGAA